MTSNSVSHRGLSQTTLMCRLNSISCYPRGEPQLAGNSTRGYQIIQDGGFATAAQLNLPTVAIPDGTGTKGFYIAGAWRPGDVAWRWIWPSCPSRNVRHKQLPHQMGVPGGEYYDGMSCVRFTMALVCVLSLSLSTPRSSASAGRFQVPPPTAPRRATDAMARM